MTTVKSGKRREPKDPWREYALKHAAEDWTPAEELFLLESNPEKANA